MKERGIGLLSAGVAAIVVFLMAWLTTIWMALATLAYLFLLAGLLNRRNKVVHRRLMTTAIILDYGLIIFLEISRDAIGTVIAQDLTLIQGFHVGFALVTAVLYIPVAWIGWNRYHERVSSQWRAWHRYLGITTIMCRSLSYIFMFSMLEKNI